MSFRIAVFALFLWFGLCGLLGGLAPTRRPLLFTAMYKLELAGRLLTNEDLHELWRWAAAMRKAVL